MRRDDCNISDFDGFCYEHGTYECDPFGAGGVARELATDILHGNMVVADTLLPIPDRAAWEFR